MKVSELHRLVQAAPDPGVFQRRDGYLRFFMQQGISPDQLYREIEMEDRLIETHRQATCPGKSSFSLPRIHSHPFYELLYCENPAGTEYVIGSDRYKLLPGDILFLAPGVNHCPIQPEILCEPFIRYSIWLSPEFMNEGVFRFTETKLEDFSRNPLLRTNPEKTQRMGDLFRQGIAFAEQQEMGWKTALVGNTLILLAYLRQIAKEGAALPIQTEQQSLVDQILGYLEQHLSEKITVSSVAKTFYVSESTISQVFRKKMGVSFYRCVTYRRLVAAKSLIQSGIPLEAVAEQTGFSDYSTFFRAFKQEFGISPRQYRKTLTPLQEETFSSAALKPAQ